MRSCEYSLAVSLILLAFCCHTWSAVGEAEKELPALPAANSPDGRKLVLGQKLALEVGEDGTLRRIANWDKLTEREKTVAFARLNERNHERLEALKEEQRTGKKKDSPTAEERQKSLLDKYMEALDALNKVTDGKDLQHELLKQAGLSAEGKGGKAGGLDYAKLQATLELLRNQKEAAQSKKTEL